MRRDLQNLLMCDAYRSGNFTLSSGKTSTHYVNCKPVTLSARGNYLVSNLILQYIDETDKYVAGLTLGADPIDVVTTGGSSLKAVKVLRDAVYFVNKVITIVDRLESDPNIWYNNDIELKSMFTINDLCG